MHSDGSVQTSLWTGCPIRSLKAHRLYAAPLERFAGLRVLLRPDAPRHPPRPLACLWLPLARACSSHSLARVARQRSSRWLSLPLFLVSLLSAKLKIVFFVSLLRLFRYTLSREPPQQLECGKLPGPHRLRSPRPVSSWFFTPQKIDLGCSFACNERDFVPRKEVIQPHLPVRLPCYDFTPITDPTLDACPPLGLAQRLQVLPTFVV